MLIRLGIGREVPKDTTYKEEIINIRGFSSNFVMSSKRGHKRKIMKQN